MFSCFKLVKTKNRLRLHSYSSSNTILLKHLVGVPLYELLQELEVVLSEVSQDHKSVSVTFEVGGRDSVNEST